MRGIVSIESSWHAVRRSSAAAPRQGSRAKGDDPVREQPHLRCGTRGRGERAGTRGYELVRQAGRRECPEASDGPRPLRFRVPVPRPFHHPAPTRPRLKPETPIAHVTHGVVCHIFSSDHHTRCRRGTRIALGSGFSRPGRHPARPRGFRLSLFPALATPLPSISDIGDYTDRARFRIGWAREARADT
jgi:hypothetical protein